MGPLLEWIKWYQEADLRKQENDLRAVALQNQRMELDYNTGRQKAAIASEAEANKPLWETPGESVGSYDQPQPEFTTGQPKPGPSANQMKAIGAGIENVPQQGLSAMGLTRPAPSPKDRYIQVGNVIWDTETKSVVYQPPAKEGDIEFETFEDEEGVIWQRVKKTDLATAREMGLIPSAAKIVEDPEDPDSARVLQPQKGQPAPTTTESGVTEKNLSTDIPVSKVPLPPGAAPTQPKLATKPATQPQGEKPQQPILPGFRSTGIKAKKKEVTPHNELDSMSNTVYPGRSWATLNPKEKDAVLKSIETLHKRQTKGTDEPAERERMAGAYKSAYTIEMRILMAKYKLMPDDAAVDSTDISAILNPTVAARLSPDQYKKYESEAKEIYDKTMGKWYKLYGIEPPGAGKSSYVRDKSGNLVPSTKK